MSFDCKKRVSRYSSRLAACALAVLCWSASAFAAQQVIINGSTTVLPVVQKAGEAFMASHPGTELSSPEPVAERIQRSHGTGIGQLSILRVLYGAA